MNEETNSEFDIKSEIFAFIWETVKIVVISLAIILPIRYYLVQPFFVKGESMEQNFYDGDYLLVDEISYRVGQPHRGDVVVFRYPKDETQFFIKRIIGLPGETVEVKNNTVKIFNADNPSGIVLKETYLSAQQQTVGNSRIKLDDNEFYVMGDNRLYSSDSRIWGPVNKANVVGKVFLRLWPLNSILRIPGVDYSVQPGN